MSAGIAASDQEEYVVRTETSMHMLGTLAHVFPLNVFSHATHDLNRLICLGE